MIQSMTAFSRLGQQADWGTVVWEIRSVNHRYLEPSFKLPENLRSLENSLRETLRKQLNRGKVECILRLQLGAGARQRIQVDKEVLSQVVGLGEAIQSQLKDPGGINPLQLLQWPGVISEAETDSDKITAVALESFQKALQQLQESRKREGEQLKAFIQQRLTTISEITAAIRQQLPAILDAQRQKLRERLEELQAQFDNDRLEQEMVILAQKSDVDEELDRLEAHIKEVHRVLKTGGACGRRLDFLMQEFNREANTLSSKSIVSDTTLAAVELKVLIEQMREQIQNIE